MTSKSATLSIRPRGKPIESLPDETSISLQDSTAELYQKLAEQSSFSIHRLRVTKGSDGSYVPNSKDVTIQRTGLRDRSTIYVKDQGPQIAWRTVFIVEYLGPLLIHPLIYLLRPYIYHHPSALFSLRFNTFPPPSTLQTLSLYLICIHFLKREFETLFIHRFSSATMPAFNIFKNSAHYWLLAGLNIAYFIYAPTSPTSRPSNPFITAIAVILFVVGELGNFMTHLSLRSLRTAGGTERGIPRGLGFDWVTCPNYMFETIAWVGIWLCTWSLSTGVFVVVAVVQMAVWAKKKERRYRKDFGDKYKKKTYAMIPGLF